MNLQIIFEKCTMNSTFILLNIMSIQRTFLDSFELVYLSLKTFLYTFRHVSLANDRCIMCGDWLRFFVHTANQRTHIAGSGLWWP